MSSIVPLESSTVMTISILLWIAAVALIETVKAAFAVMRGK